MRKLLLFIFLFQVSGLWAQKFAGGEIYYKLISNNKYKVTAQVYRVCTDSSLNSLNGFVQSDSFKISMSFKRISITRINDTCGNPCNIQNKSSNPGYEKHVFIDTVDFNKAPFNQFVKAGNCYIRFAIQQYKRDSSSNINSTGNNLFYMEAMVNICLNVSKNASPEFAFEPKFLACCNQPFIYNMGIIDSSDVDSLAFELAPALSDYGTPVSYNGSYNAQIPMTPYCPPNPGVINCRALPSAKPPRGFYFDKETGDFSFTPTNCDEIGVIKVLVSEYRKDSSNKFVLLGKVSREMQVKIKSCTNNNPPYFTGTNKYTVCENNQICFTIGTKDEPFLPYQTKPDTVTVNWNYGIPGAICIVKDPSAREKDMQFCWKTPNSQSVTYNRFGVVAYDKLCNIGMSSRGYIITKKPSAKTIRTFKTDKCNQLKYQIAPIDSVNTPLKSYAYIVTIASVNNPNSNLFYSSKNNDSFNAPYSGKYLIKTQANNLNFNCPVINIDTIELFAAKAIVVNSKDTLVCQGDSVRLSPYNADFSQFRFKWYDSELGNTVADTQSTYMSKQHGLTKTIRYEIRGGLSCVYIDSVKLISRGAFSIQPNGKNLTLCSGVTDTLIASNFKGTAPFALAWTIDGQLATNNDTFGIKLYKDAHIKLTVSDQSGCTAEDTVYAHVIPLPKIGFTDTSLCYNDTAIINSRVNIKDPNFRYKWLLDNVIQQQTVDSFRIVVKGNHNLSLTVKASGDCSVSKTMQVYYHPLPNFTIIGDTVFNKANYIVLSASKVFNAYKWSNGTNTKDNGFWAYTLGAPGAYSQALEVTDSNGCKSVETHWFRTNGLTGIDKAALSNIVIHPNPFTESISIESKEDGTYSILNTEGKIVAEGLLTEGKQSIQLKHLSAGIYYLQINGQKYPIIKSN